MDDDAAETTIERLAKEKLNMRLGVRKELRSLFGHLGEGEQPLNMARGEYDGKQGLVVVTDRRILFTEQGWVRSKLGEFPYEKISSIESGGGLTGGKLTIYVSGHRGEIKSVVPKERVREIVEYVRGRILSPAAPAAPSADDAASKLRALAELRDSGLITSDEFEAKRQALVAQL